MARSCSWLNQWEFCHRLQWKQDGLFWTYFKVGTLFLWNKAFRVTATFQYLAGSPLNSPFICLADGAACCSPVWHRRCTGLSWMMATQGLVCVALVAVLCDGAERRWALLLLSLGTFSLSMLECLEETATASIFQHLWGKKPTCFSEHRVQRWVVVSTGELGRLGGALLCPEWLW